MSSDFAREACAWKFRAWSAGFTLSQTTEAGHPHQEWRGSAGPGERARLGRCRVRLAPDLWNIDRPSAAFFSNRPARARAGTPEGGRAPRDHWRDSAHRNQTGGTTSVSSHSRAAQPHPCQKKEPRCARESSAATEHRPPGIDFRVMAAVCFEGRPLPCTLPSSQALRAIFDGLPRRSPAPRFCRPIPAAKPPHYWWG